MKRIFLMSIAALMAFSAQAVEFMYNGAYLQGATDSSVFVVWTTDVASESWVEFTGGDIKGKKVFYEMQNGMPVLRRNHRVPVTGLTPGTLYQYQVFSKDPRTQQIISQKLTLKGEPLTFKTLDKDKEEISWLMATDIHYNKYIKNLFQDIFTSERLAGKDFIIFDGDIADSFSSEKAHYERLFADVTKTFTSAHIPYYMARGNHETRGNAADDYLSYHPTWTDMPYFAFRHGPVFFIFLDSGEDKPDSDIEYYGKAAFDDYRRCEGEWLAKVLASKECQEAPFRVVINHIPLMPNSWHGSRHAHAMLTPHLEEGNIALMISGHTHRYGYRDCGVDSKNFPTLVFAPQQFLDIKANSKTLTIEVKNLAGEVEHTFTYESNK